MKVPSRTMEFCRRTSSLPSRVPKRCIMKTALQNQGCNDRCRSKSAPIHYNRNSSTKSSISAVHLSSTKRSITAVHFSSIKRSISAEHLDSIASGPTRQSTSVTTPPILTHPPPPQRDAQKARRAPRSTALQVRGINHACSDTVMLL